MVAAAAASKEDAAETGASSEPAASATPSAAEADGAEAPKPEPGSQPTTPESPATQAAPAASESAATAELPATPKRRFLRRPSLPRPSLRRPSLPRPSLPRPALKRPSRGWLIAGGLVLLLLAGVAAVYLATDFDFGDDQEPAPAPRVVIEEEAAPREAPELGFPAFATKNTTRVAGDGRRGRRGRSGARHLAGHGRSGGAARGHPRPRERLARRDRGSGAGRRPGRRPDPDLGPRRGPRAHPDGADRARPAGLPEDRRLPALQVRRRGRAARAYACATCSATTRRRSPWRSPTYASG